MKHHLMVGTWTPPGAIFSFEFDDEALTLNMIKRTEIPKDEPISWMTFDVSDRVPTHPMFHFGLSTSTLACQEKHLWSCHEEMVKFHCQ